MEMDGWISSTISKFAATIESKRELSYIIGVRIVFKKEKKKKKKVYINNILITQVAMKDRGSLSIIILHGIIIFLFVLYLWSVFAPTKPKNPNPKIPILTSSKSTRKVKKAGGETGITFYSS